VEKLITYLQDTNHVNARQGALVTVVIVLVATLIATASVPDVEDDDGRLKVVASFYPLGFMAEELGGEHVRVTTLIPPNQDVHSWHPTTSDIIEANRADLLIYHGADLDPWFEDEILPVVDRDGVRVLETTRRLDLIHLDDDDDEEGDHDHGGEDPHTWLSPERAMQMVDEIRLALIRADPSNSPSYDANRNLLIGRLSELLDMYEEGLAGARNATMIVTHEAYGYLARDFHLVQMGVIGISADEQPSARTMGTIVDLMVKGDIHTVFVDPIYSDDYAMTLRRELEARSGTEVEVQELYFMLGPVDGLDFVEQMEANLDSLVEGLGEQTG
jgi:zinc transport system substrate-binding protein